MTIKKIWLGSVGPYLYDDSAQISDPYGLVSGVQAGLVTTGHISCLAAPTEEYHVLRKGELDGYDPTTGLSPGAITSDFLADLSILAKHIASGVITADKIGAGEINATHIGIGVISADHIGDAAITADKIGTGAIVANHIGNAVITAEHIGVAAIVAEHISLAAISGYHIEQASIKGYNIGKASITGGHIAEASISAIHIGSAVIEGYHIGEAVITGTNIALGTIQAVNIETGTITALQIANATITGAKIALATITGGNIGTGEITGGLIADGAIVGGHITNQTIQAGKIANLTITAAQIANLTITGGPSGKIATSTISEDNIVAGTITALSIAGETITGDKIAGNTITGNKIVANAITASHIDVSTLSALSADVGTLTAGIIRSFNWGANSGFEFDLTNASMTIREPSGLLVSTAYGITVGGSGSIRILDGGDLILRGMTSNSAKIIYELSGLTITTEIQYSYNEVRTIPSSNYSGIFQLGTTARYFDSIGLAASQVVINAYDGITIRTDSTVITANHFNIYMYKPVIPYGSTSIDLGSSTYQFRDLYLSRYLRIGGSIYPQSDYVTDSHALGATTLRWSSIDCVSRIRKWFASGGQPETYPNYLQIDEGAITTNANNTEGGYLEVTLRVGGSTVTRYIKLYTGTT